MVKRLNISNVIVIAASIGLLSHSPYMTADPEMRSLVQQLDLFVSEKIVTGQKAQLNQDFRARFRTLADLTPNQVSKYFTQNPLEVMAFREYAQKLVDLGTIDTNTAQNLVISAFQALESAPSNRDLAYEAVGQSPNESTIVNQNIDVNELQLDSSTSQETPSEPAIEENQLLDFGEALDKQQNESLAAQKLQDELAEKERGERNKRLAQALIEEFSNGKPTPESLGKRVEKVVTKFAEEESRQQAENTLDNVEISITSVSDGPRYSLRGLKAFDSVNPNLFSFTEFGMTSDDSDTTANIGIGIRKLSADQTIMGGLNAFYDQEIETGHKRASIGVEVISTPLRFNANRYYALSDGHAINALQTEKPLSGHDIDVEVALPYFPGLFAGYNTSEWYAEDGAENIEREIYRLRGNLSQHLSVELGRRSYNNTLEDQDTAKLSYNYVFGGGSDQPTLIDMDTLAYRHNKIGSRERYRMVERENQIVTQVVQAGLTVTFTGL